MSAIGPQLPPHLQASTSASASQPPLAQTAAPATNDSDSDSDDYAPALPPSLAASRTSSHPAKRPRIVGPAPPPPDDSDDEVGPSVALASRPGEGATGVSEFLEREARWAKEREERDRPKEMKREEWMLVPPEQGELAQTLDPLKARSFSRVSTDPTTTRDQTLWTETPAERQQRLQDEIAGRKRKADGTGPQAVDEGEAAERARSRRRDQEIQKSINDHNASHRAAPLLEQHTKSSKSGKSAGPGAANDDPPPIWDRDVHMAVTGKLLDEGERRKMIRDAKGLGDRFGHGKRGAYS